MIILQQLSISMVINLAVGSVIWLGYRLLEKYGKYSATQQYYLLLGMQFTLFISFVLPFLGTKGSIQPGINILNNYNILYTNCLNKQLTILYTILFMGKLGLFIVQNYFPKGKYQPLEQPETIVQFVQTRMEELGIRRKVHIGATEATCSPFTKGFLKPMIVLPMAAINGLTPQQMEAVLWHELIHIKRADYLLNIGQLIIENVLCFNPFAYLMGKKARIYRELSCDEMVIAGQNNPLEYAESLLRLAKMNQNEANNIVQTLYTPSDNQLKHRVEKILHQKNYPLRKNAFVLPVALLFLILTAGTALSLHTITIPTPGTDDLLSAKQNIVTIAKNTLPTIQEVNAIIPAEEKKAANKSKKIRNKQSQNIDNKKVVSLQKHTKTTHTKLRRITEPDNLEIAKMDFGETPQAKTMQINSQEPVTIYHTASMDSLKLVVSYLLAQLQQRGESMIGFQQKCSSEMQYSNISYPSEEPNIKTTTYLYTNNYIVYIEKNNDRSRILLLQK